MRFDELNLEEEILDGLWDMHFEEMTPVQEHTIPVILEGHDMIGCAKPVPVKRLPIRCHSSIDCFWRATRRMS